MSQNYQTVISLNRCGNSINPNDMIFTTRGNSTEPPDQIKFMSLDFQGDMHACQGDMHARYYYAGEQHPITRGNSTKLPDGIKFTIEKLSNIPTCTILGSIIKYMAINPFIMHRTKTTIVALMILVKNCDADVNEIYVLRDHSSSRNPYGSNKSINHAYFRAKRNFYLSLMCQKFHLMEYLWTPLVYAAYIGDIDIVKYLVRCGATVNPSLSLDGVFLTGTPLMYAANHGDIDMVQYLVENGANVNASLEQDDVTVLKSALKSSRKSAIHDIVKYLVEKGANLNTVDFRPPHLPQWMYAVKLGRVDTLKFLLTWMQDTTMFDIQTALLGAVNFGHQELIKYLVNEYNEILNHHVEILDDDYDDDQYFQHIKNRRNDYKVTCGEYALLSAAENGHKDLVKYFINQKVDINIRNCDGMTPLSLAAEYGYDDLAIYLTEHGSKR